LLHARKWKKPTSDVLIIWFTMAGCQKLRKADSDDLRIIFIQTIATCQKVKKADLRCFDNLIHNSPMPETEKSGLRRFKNNFYSDNCYMPETEKSGPPMFWEFDSQWPDARIWKKRTPDILRTIFIQTIATRNWKKADSDDLRIIFIQTIATYQKLEKADSDILRIIFIQTIATYQKLKKPDIWYVENLIHNGQMPESEKSGPPMFWEFDSQCQMPESEKSGLWHFENLIHNCYMPESEKSGLRHFDNFWVITYASR